MSVFRDFEQENILGPTRKMLICLLFHESSIYVIRVDEAYLDVMSVNGEYSYLFYLFNLSCSLQKRKVQPQALNNLSSCDQ